MKIQTGNPIEKDEVMDLWRYCFDDTEDYIQHYFTRIYNKKNNITITHDNKLIASMFLNPYTLNIRGNKLKTSYVVGVSVQPHMRGQNLTRFLIDKGFEESKQKGEIIQMLMPIKTSLYTRFGYINIADMSQYTIDLDQIEKDTSSLQIEMLDYSANYNKYLNDLQQIYNQFAKENLLTYVQRDTKYYDILANEVQVEGGKILIAYANNTPVSYMIIYPKYSSQEPKIFIRELISITKSGYTKLLNIAKSHSTQGNQILLHQAPTNHIDSILQYNNQIKKEILPFMMIRIIDAKALLETIIKPETNLIINIKDNLISQNNKTFILKNNKVTVNHKQPDIQIDIKTLALLYTGKITIKQAQFNENLRLEENIINQLQDLFPPGISYFNDYV